METPASLPTLFISHGAPAIAMDPGSTGPAWEQIGRAIVDRHGKPSAILVLSSHWMTPEPAVMSWLRAPVLHDFYGFPEPLYRLDYPSQGSPVWPPRFSPGCRWPGCPVSLTLNVASIMVPGFR